MKLVHLDSFVYIQKHAFEEVKFQAFSLCKSFALNITFDNHPAYTFSILYIFPNITAGCIKCVSYKELTHFRDSLSTKLLGFIINSPLIINVFVV